MAKPEIEGPNLIYVPVRLTDDNGISNMLDERRITVNVEGAELLAVGSGSTNQDSVQPYIGNSITTYEGCALAVIRRYAENNNITIKISAEGIDEAAVVKL